MILKTEENILQQELDRFASEVTASNLVINDKKSFVMVCNPSKKYDFPPEFKVGNSKILEIKSSLKILGIIIQDDLRWGKQVDQMAKKASKKIWMLRRMKKMGLDERSICNFWKAEGRVHLEPASAVWTSGITVQQSRKLQRVQNRAVAAFSDKREDPKISAIRLKLELLDERRQKLALKFAQQTVKKSRHSDMFTKLENPHTSRGGAKREWREPPCKTRRHLKSALPYLTRLLNGEKS